MTARVFSQADDETEAEVISMLTLRPETKAANQYLNQVRRITRKMCARAFREADREDLYGAALLGLAESMTRFNPDRKIDFWSFAKHRIVGAVRDELRRQDPLTRGERSMARRLAQNVGADGELSMERAAEKAGLDSGQVDTIRTAMQRRWAAPLEDVEAASLPEDALPDERCHNTRMRRIVRKHMNRLPTRNRDVIRMLYFEELSTVEVARRLGLSQGRVSQIRGETLTMMRDSMAPLEAAA